MVMKTAGIEANGCGQLAHRRYAAMPWLWTELVTC